jgi:hypothetical protein
MTAARIVVIPRYAGIAGPRLPSQERRTILPQRLIEPSAKPRHLHEHVGRDEDYEAHALESAVECR